MEKMKEFFVIIVSLKTLPSFFIITVSCPSVQFPITLYFTSSYCETLC